MAKTIAALICVALTGCATAGSVKTFAVADAVVIYVEVIDETLGCPLGVTELVGDKLPPNTCEKENKNAGKS